MIENNMDYTEVQYRLATLKEFEHNLNDRLDKLTNFVDIIGWSWDEIPEINDSMVECPLIKEHKIHPSKFDVHYEVCKLKRQGYDKSIKLYPELGCYNLFNQTLRFDDHMQLEVIKKCHLESNFSLNIKSDFRGVSQSIQQYVCDFTPDERRILYNHAVSSTKKPSNEGACSVLIESDKFIKANNEELKSELELLQEQRDAKRRRIAYRGKRVHTDRKSYIEVLREVIEGQINSLTTNSDDQKNVHENVQSTNVKLVNNNRVYYKFEGSRHFSGNPYTRWMNIEKEESTFFKYIQRKSYTITSTSSSRFHSKDKADNHTSSQLRKSRSRSIGKNNRHDVSKDKYNLEKSKKKSKSPKHKHKKKSKSSKSHKKSHRSRSKSHKNNSRRYKSRSKSRSPKSRSRS
ncbi:U11/U12 small nuclear ribonucleoprotein 48 kDa protein-like [Daktulosphaira vitifoliae]|uniref:U11/U12 small nuclear ribonucleoprotein 48 kDa protein-like n=1 Tax=Daktulosphaira vitifoliae TaxID=58002 RepID=UPI0021AACBE6|nr:U11/U12 small nuclear ribonucleoprotein 48 kDa protein-like [Daktulosphaira vitifoliae]